MVHLFMNWKVEPMLRSICLVSLASGSAKTFHPLSECLDGGPDLGVTIVTTVAFFLSQVKAQSMAKHTRLAM
jgi:hypothetical protein